MSADTAAPMETPKKQKKSKDKTSKSSSKKRAREEPETQPITTSKAPSPSPSKKQRTTAPTTSNTTVSAAPTNTDLEAKTPFVTQTTSLYLPLSPVAHPYPIQGLSAEHLSPHLLTYYPPLDGILLSYSNARLSTSPHNAPKTTPTGSGEIVLAQSVDEYGVSFVWLTADFLLLRPERGRVVEGLVRVQNPSYLGLVCYNFFNATIERARLPADWVWVGGNGASGAEKTNAQGGAEAVEDLEGEGGHAAAEEEDDTGEGYFVNGQGEKVDGLVRFHVRDFESAPSTERERGFVAIEGTMLDAVEDRKLDDEIKEKNKDKTKGRRLGRMGQPLHGTR